MIKIRQSLELGFALLLVVTMPAFAQAPSQGGSLLPGSNSKEPINIAADKLDYFDKEQKAVYSGNVVVVQGDTRLNASVLTIFFDKKNSNSTSNSSSNALKSMKGDGPITIVSKDQVGIGDTLIYDKQKHMFNLKGNVSLSQGENITKGDELVYDLQTGQAVVSARDNPAGGAGGRVHSRILPDNKGAQSAQPSKPRAGQ